MSPDDYLYGLVRKYAVNIDGAKTAGNKIYPVLEKWGNGFLIRAEFSGSLAKGTGISLSTDADIFLSLSSATPDTLADIYKTLCIAVKDAGYPVRRQDVSVGTTVNGYSIDLVPGRRQSQYGNEHSLYRNRTGKWTKTNVKAHIALVAESGRINEIQILKIWRNRHRLRFPSFYLELAALDALRYARHGEIAANVLCVLQYLSKNIESSRFIDPSNTNNIISEDCTSVEKTAIALQAIASLGMRTWEEIVW